ncbi:uncharacterized protein LOC110983448 [Acanthaster planci]|uniref:Uncharacterized protein LOC110983448 n=1 Tax=Acanthaster planci TaxID=133434 RepID=A0A8B7Z0F7_ACAPL|nr:uncharacterized protein LOC110983448 [Acanthaster planci]
MNSSDPYVRDRGIITTRDREVSLQLHRKNSMQREQLGKQLKRLDKEQQECIRRTHMEKCAISRDQKCLVSDLNKFTFSQDDPPLADDAFVDQQARTDEPTRSPPAVRRKEAATATHKASTRRVSLPDELHDPGASEASTKDKERFIDQKKNREITKLKKASLRMESGNKKDSDERKGKPNIPINAWYHDNHAKARERSSSVFDRLSEGSNLNSMSSEQFLQRVRKQRSHTLPPISTRTRTAERR